MISSEFLIQEAQALQVRLRQVQPFDLNMPMVGAAAISETAQKEIRQMLKKGRHKMASKIQNFIELISSSKEFVPHLQQSAYAALKLEFNALLDRLDIFADVLTQRSEHHVGIWLAGLDVLARDALVTKNGIQNAPPLICFLDRGHGAAIRRVRTRLPGGPYNPVAVIRVPRERMISTGIASSLVHEVGHQGAALLDLVNSLRASLEERAASDFEQVEIWNLYSRWISEIVSDFWSVATLGVGSTTGLINVVSLPRYFVFRLGQEGPHPPPWIRVHLSIGFGEKLYPCRQWEELKALWNKLYPLRLAGENADVYRQLFDLLPEFVDLLIHHRSSKLGDHKLRDIFPIEARQPRRLRALFQNWKRNPNLLKTKKPALAFAILGQARADDQLNPDQEYQTLERLFQYWAMNR